MIAPSRIRCRVIAVPVSPGRIDRYQAARPSELLPWADPYIAGLVAKLQREVRVERQVNCRRQETEWADEPRLFGRRLFDFELDAGDLETSPSADVEWPWTGDDSDEEPADDHRTRDWDDGPGDVPALN